MNSFCPFREFIPLYLEHHIKPSIVQMVFYAHKISLNVFEKL